MRLMSFVFFVGVSVSSVLVLNACSSKKDSGGGVSLGLPMLKPIVEGATPVALQGPQALGLDVAPLSCGADADCWAQAELAGIMIDLMGNGLDMFDQRLNELNVRTAENTRQCTLEEPIPWTASDLPDGEERTFYLQCAETHGEVLSVYFGVREGMAYLIERTRGSLTGNRVPPEDSEAGDQILMAIADMSGNAVEIWVARHKGYSEVEVQVEIDEDLEIVSRYNRSWLYIKADRGANTLEASISGQPWPGHGLTCGATLRANATHFNLGMTLSNRTNNWGTKAYCDLGETWGHEAVDVSGCFDSENFDSTPGQCTEIDDLSHIPDLRAHTPDGNTNLSLMGGGCEGASAMLDAVDEWGATGCYARAYTLITSSKFPSLRDFNDILIEDEEE